MNRRTLSALLVLALFAAHASPATLAFFTTPVAASFATAVPVSAQSVVQLQGSDADGTPLVYAIVASPTHGAISQLNTATGALVYTPTVGYTGSDSFTYTVTSGGETTSAATVSLTVTAAKTRIIDTFTNPDGTPRQGKVTFVLTQAASSPSGLIPASSSVSCALTSTGQCDVYLYPSRAVSPVQFYQVYFYDAGGSSQLLGVYDIPASVTTISLAGHRVTDTNLAAQYTFASKAEVDALTQAVAAATTAQLFPSLTAGSMIKWSGTTFANATGSDVPVHSAAKVTSGVLDPDRIPDLDAAKITTGNLDARTSATTSEAASTIVKRDAAGHITGTFVGNGAGLTGVAGATGGVSNTGSTTIGADSDADGVGKISLQTGGVERASIDADGTPHGFAVAGTTAGTLAAGDDARFVSGTWSHMGTVLSAALPAQEGNIGEPSVIANDSNPQLLTSYATVWKMWFGGGYTSPAIYYAESPDGQKWSMSGLTQISGHLRCRVFKVGSTYHAYTALANGTQVDHYTSPNGYTGWTLAAANVIPRGGGWDSSQVQSTAVWIEGSTWFMLYEGTDGISGKYSIGLATSTDGNTWTKYAGNPVITSTGSNSRPAVPRKIGGIYYLYFHRSATGVLPSDIYRIQSTDLHTWTNALLVFPRTTQDEGGGSSVGQTSDMDIVESGGRTFLYYTGSPDGSQAAGSHIKLAVADMPLAQLVQTTEGVKFATVSASAITASIGSGLADHVEAFRTTNQSIPDSTLTPIFFDNDENQSGSVHSTTVAPSRFTAMSAGKYEFECNALFAGNATGVRAILMQKNGPNSVYYGYTQVPASASGNGLSTGHVFNLAAGDFVECYVFQSQTPGSALNITATNGRSPGASFTKVGN